MMKIEIKIEKRKLKIKSNLEMARAKVKQNYIPVFSNYLYKLFN